MIGSNLQKIWGFKLAKKLIFSLSWKYIYKLNLVTKIQHVIYRGGLFFPQKDQKSSTKTYDFAHHTMMITHVIKAGGMDVGMKNVGGQNGREAADGEYWF